MSSLVIVESPAKCKKIESYLGKGYKCIASFGHIREMSNGMKSLTKDLKPIYVNSKSKIKKINEMRKLIKHSKEVILASDDDREGEAIAWHICMLFNLPIKTTKRIIFHEITKPAVQYAIQNPTTINMNKVFSQQARSVIDILVGYKISPILWRNITFSSTTKLSAGRCQTPALRIIYEREKEIKEQIQTKSYFTNAWFTKNNIQFQLNKQIEDREKIETFLENSVNHEHIIQSIKPNESIRNKPLPFTTSSLQQKASNILHFSPKKTMMCAQTLYENGYITYMRTDNKKYSKDFVKSAINYIRYTWDEKYISKNLKYITLNESKNKTGDDKNNKNNKNIAQEAHEAIRPTNIKTVVIDNLKIKNSEKQLYKLIWRNTIQSCMENAVFDTLTCKLTAPDNMFYKKTEDSVKFLGFLIAEDYVHNNANYKLFKKLKIGAELDYNKIYSSLEIRNGKGHYTEAKLVSILEEKGIGRPSTFSNIISKIQDRNYVNKKNVEGKEIKCVDFKLIGNEIEEIETNKTFGNEKNKLVSEQLGDIVCNFLLRYFGDLFEYEFTRDMETMLDQIESGEKTYNEVVLSFNKTITDMIKNNKIKKDEIKIDKNHTYMIGKFGPVIKCNINGSVSFKKVKKNIDMDMLKNGEYSIKDIVDNSGGGSNILGQHNGKDITIKKGKFGYYLNHDNSNYSLKSLKLNDETIRDFTLEKAIEIINDGGIKIKASVVKKINDNSSIRNGKFGMYVYHKTSTMKKPVFLPLKKAKIEDITEEWIANALTKKFNK